MAQKGRFSWVRMKSWGLAPHLFVNILTYPSCISHLIGKGTQLASVAPNTSELALPALGGGFLEKNTHPHNGSLQHHCSCEGLDCPSPAPLPKSRLLGSPCGQHGLCEGLHDSSEESLVPWCAGGEEGASPPPLTSHFFFVMLKAPRISKDCD